MDRAEIRRNSVSVNRAYGNLDATYSGNYLFSKAVSILSSYGTAVNQLSCQYISDLCLGQLLEAENAYNLSISSEMHLDIIAKKTASLFEFPCKIGAILAHADTVTQNALTSYGTNVGIAFQLIDDFLDLKGNTDKMGKKGGNDLKEGVYTYATIEALKYGNESRYLADILLQEELGECDIHEATDLIEKCGGLDRARRKAEAFIQKSLEALEVLPRGDTRRSLENLAEFILAREH
jgi:geranylgeranyl pyrophosphate synthase